jgi:hypothetical protein
MRFPRPYQPDWNWEEGQEEQGKKAKEEEEKEKEKEEKAKEEGGGKRRRKRRRRKRRRRMGGSGVTRGTASALTVRVMSGAKAGNAAAAVATLASNKHQENLFNI